MGALSFEEREADEFVKCETDAGDDAQASPLTHQPAMHAGGCPGSRMLDFTQEVETSPVESTMLKSELRQWPVKLNLLNPAAPYLENADLVLAADCSAFACASFHPEFLRKHVLAIGCPKFDDVNRYIDKLAAMIVTSNIKSITVVHMEVPCCSGLLFAAQKAIEASGREVPLEEVVVGIRGGRVAGPKRPGGAGDGSRR